ncbi:hypothetical protein ASPVEDRAFT_26757 [Aspergillus versicolor CBS 583.65]|uniref:Uncharacterized protein n=1 Tax=Aspergillus versicolor CBS 583.65 TaxID=1036611 RepID=A0A1L9PEM2_ASPVE|nr:uncharacterized protein ASPVEDRAFT_26757 [Aspergillus versicolor CBS 583.65]OJI99996.1 hypothetical protein ASPVEDRAFT_26757 [Aspergillus versicolor CBS 583.65]
MNTIISAGGETERTETERFQDSFNFEARIKTPQSQSQSPHLQRKRSEHGLADEHEHQQPDDPEELSSLRGEYQTWEEYNDVVGNKRRPPLNRKECDASPRFTPSKS